jgi:hypothetical protein
MHKVKLGIPINKASIGDGKPRKKFERQHGWNVAEKIDGARYMGVCADPQKVLASSHPIGFVDFGCLALRCGGIGPLPICLYAFLNFNRKGRRR